MKKDYLICVFCLFYINLYSQNTDIKDKKAIILYKGEKRPDSEISKIYNGKDYRKEDAPSIKFSGKYFDTYIKNPLKTKISLKTIRSNQCVEILPSKAEICINAIVSVSGPVSYKWKKCLIFTAEAGHNYSIEACSGVNPAGWIVDRSNNKIVASEGNIPDVFFTANSSVSK